MVCGVGGAGGNAVNNMIVSGLSGVDFIVANTDAQALTSSRAERIIQMGLQVTEGLGAGSKPEIGKAAAEEALEEIRDHLAGAHMVFVTAGMGGGTGTGAAPVIAKAAREMGILTVGVVTKPFHFEGGRRMRVAETGISELHKAVDTLIIIPNQNLFRVANEKTTFADAFAMADQVLYSGVACITDLMVKEGLINLDFADVRSIMSEMGKAMMGTGEAAGEKRAVLAAEAAIANPLLDETSMRGARGLLISITGGNDLTLYEVDEAASRIRQEVDEEANIILGATFEPSLDGVVRVSVVATGIDQASIAQIEPVIVQPRAEVPLRARAPVPTPARAAAAATEAAIDFLRASATRKSSRRRPRPQPFRSRSTPARMAKKRVRTSFRRRRNSRSSEPRECRRSRTCRSWRKISCAPCGKRRPASLRRRPNSPPLAAGETGRVRHHAQRRRARGQGGRAVAARPACAAAARRPAGPGRGRPGSAASPCAARGGGRSGPPRPPRPSSPGRRRRSSGHPRIPAAAAQLIRPADEISVPGPRPPPRPPAA